MPKISLEELTRIAGEIERTPSEERGDISNAEFAWLYKSGQPLQQLKRQTGEIAGLFMMDGSGIVFEDYSGTDAVANIHNHPSGNMQFTLEDINALLGGVTRGKNLKYSLIASTNTGKVNGFYELEYAGKRANAAALMEANNDIYRAHLGKKYDFLDKHPEVRAQMKIGESILSPQEYHTMVTEAMTASSIVGRARPLTGYLFADKRFVPE